MNEPTQFGRYQVVQLLGRGAIGLAKAHGRWDNIMAMLALVEA